MASHGGISEPRDAEVLAGVKEIPPSVSWPSEAGCLSWGAPHCHPAAHALRDCTPQYLVTMLTWSYRAVEWGKDTCRREATQQQSRQWAFECPTSQRHLECLYFLVFHILLSNWHETFLQIVMLQKCQTLSSFQLYWKKNLPHTKGDLGITVALCIHRAMRIVFKIILGYI